MRPAKLFILTTCTMVAFASNSLLCRLALRHTNIDAATFTLVRVASGAAAVWLIMKMRSRRSSPATGRQNLAGDWLSALALFVYAAGFSFAYNTLPAGTGALLLFGAVQATMIFWGLRQGETLHARQLIGLVVALSGLVILLFPGLSAPSPIGSILMIGAGVAWGLYSLRGKKGDDPGSATAGNFLRAVPLAIALSIAFIPWTRVDRTGILYALISGTLTSGLGYIIWYTALPNLKATSAATVQLSVPVLAATGGILLLGETLTMRFVFASIAVLGGIALVVIEKRWRPNLT